MAIIYMLVSISVFSAVIQRVGDLFLNFYSYLPAVPFLRAIFAKDADVGFALVFSGSLGFLLLEPTIQSWVDALYLTVATLTTVGYGDFSPTTPASRLLMVVLALSGMNLFCGQVLSQTGSWAKSLEQTALGRASVLAPVLVIVGCGTAAFALLEGWSIGDAMYFCIITSTTVGYGDHLSFPTTSQSSSMFESMFSASKGKVEGGLTSDASKLVACMYIVFSVDCMGLLLSRVGDRLMRVLEDQGITMKPKLV